MNFSSKAIKAQSSKLKLKTKCIIFLAVLIFAGSSASAAQSTEETDFLLAKKAFNDGFYGIAAERAGDFLRNYSNTPFLYEAHNLLGRACYNQNNYSQAILEFGVVLDAPAAGEFQDEALYWSAEIYLKEGDFKKALEFFQRTAEDFPSSRYSPYAVYSRAWAYYKLGSAEDALASFREVVAKYPFEKVAMESQFRIGRGEYLLARYGKAEEELDIFLKKFPVSEKTAEAYYLKGEAEFYLNEYKDAIVDLEKAMSISPGADWAPLARYRKACAYFKSGDYEKSIEEFQKCADGSGSSFIRSSSLLGLMQSYEKKGLPALDTEKACDEVIAKYRDSDAAPEAYRRKAHFLYKAKRYKDAEAVCREAVGRFPDSECAGLLHYELGLIYAAQAEGERATGEFMSADRVSNDANLSSSAACKTGDGYFEKKDYPKAMERYDLVLNAYPESPWADHAQYQIGRIFLITGKYDQSILAYQSVLANFPKTRLADRAMRELGIAYFLKGDFEHAATEFELFMKEFPGRGDLDDETRLYLANSFYNMAKYYKALELFKALARESSDDSIRRMARYQIGWCYYNLGEEGASADEFGAFLKDHPESAMAADAMYQLALILYDEGKADEALARLEELAAKFADSELAADAYRKIAKIRKDRKDFDKSIEYLQKALGSEDNESNAQIQYEIAEAYEEKGEPAKSAEEYLKVPRLYGKGTFWSVRARFKCAKAFEALGKTEEAKELYEKLAAMDVEESGFAKKRLEALKGR